MDRVCPVYSASTKIGSMSWKVSQNKKMGEIMDKKYCKVEIIKDQCKGCELCIVECPKGCLFMSEDFNRLGYTYAKYTGKECTACGICFYACPEVGTIRVTKKSGSEK